MRSQLAETARQTLAEEVRRMTPEARLAAFLAHNELMAQLRAAGEALRAQQAGRATPSAGLAYSARAMVGA
jgi:hypothetical protein